MIRFLQQNNSTMKFLFGVIIVAALGTMAITLIPGIFDNAGASGSDLYATVHNPGWMGRFESGSPVKLTEVNQLAARQLQQQNLPEMLLPYMAQRAGQILVQRQILKNEADRLHLQVSDDDLRRELEHGAFAQYLFPNGSYIGDEAYINFVSTYFHTTRADFESQVKNDMELNRLQALITGGINVSDNAVREAYLRQGTKVNFDYAVVSSEDVAKGINPSEAQLQQFFRENAARYATAIPEQRKIAYVSFDASSLPGGKPPVTDAAIQGYYNAHRAQYAVKDQSKVRHILIAVPRGADAKTDAAAKSKAEDVLKQVKAGGNFAELAQKYSDDPGSKAQGGELGWLNPGQTVPEFDKAAFSLQPGQTSGLVKTQFGYHILQVEDRKAAHEKPLSEVRAEIVPVLEQQQVGAAEQSFANQLTADAAKGGLQKAAASHGLHMETTDYVSKDGTVAGLSDASALLDKAFSAAKGAAPESVATGDGYAVFQVLDSKPAHAPEFAAYREHILTDYREQQIPQLMQAQLVKLDDRAKQLGSLQKAAAELNLPVKSSGLVGRTDQVPDLGAMNGAGAVAFSLARGAVSGPINTGRTGVVLAITDKQQPGTEELAKSFGPMKEELLNQQRDEIFRVYLSSLTERYQKSGAIRYARRPAGAAGPGAPPTGTL